MELQLFNTDAREFGQAIDAALQKRQSSSSPEEGPQDSGNSSATTDTKAFSGLVDNLSAKFAFLERWPGTWGQLLKRSVDIHLHVGGGLRVAQSASPPTPTTCPPPTPRTRSRSRAR